MAERVGFEPTCPFGQHAFEARPLRPLRYLSALGRLSRSPELSIIAFGPEFKRPPQCGSASGRHDDAAVEEVDVTLHLRFPPRIVRDHAHRRSAGMKFIEHVHQRLAALRVEVAGWFVGQQDGGPARDGARHRHQLLLTAGKVAGMVFGSRR